MCNHAWELSGKWGRDGKPLWVPPHSSALTLKYENKTNGKWNTSSLAAYPASFCKFIADSLAEPSAAASSAPSPLGLLVPDQDPAVAATNGAVVPDRASEANQSSGSRAPGPGSATLTTASD